MNYRKITENVANNLNLAEIYGFYVLAFKSDFNTMESNVNITTLAELINISESTVKRWINKYKDNGLLIKETKRIKYNDKWFNKNVYQLSFNNYKYITDGLIKMDLPIELKGFLILLKCRCYNCSNLCEYSIRELAETTSISKTTIGKYIKDAEELGLISRKNNKIELLDSNIFIEAKESVFYSCLKTYPEILTDLDIAKRMVI